MHCSIRRWSFPKLISHAVSPSCRITREEDAIADPAYQHRTAAGGGGRHRSTHSSMAIGEGHQAPAKQSCRPASSTGATSPPMEHRRGNPLPPLVFDGRGAAIAAAAGSSAGASNSGGLWVGCLRGSCAGGRRSSAAREGGYFLFTQQNN
jgi:hypothetical protein